MKSLCVYTLGGAKKIKSLILNQLCVFSHSPCSTDSKNIKMSSGDPWEVLPVGWSFSGPKYKGNGHNFGFYFVLAITF